MVSGVLRGKFVPTQTHISSKSVVSDLFLNVSTKSNHYLVSNYIILFEPVPINVCQRVNVVKSFFCHFRVTSIAKPIFLILNTAPSLNVCKAVNLLVQHITPVEFFQSQMML